MQTQYFPVDREAIWVALFNHLTQQLSVSSSPAGPFITIGRRHVTPPELEPAQQPALFVIQVKETHEPRPRGVPTRLILHGFLVVYVFQPALNETPGQETHLAATDLNNFLMALDQAFEPDNPQGYFTLGGMVSHCWIESDTDQDPGIFGQQAVALVPIHILVP
jgi:hypothetical protein